MQAYSALLDLTSQIFYSAEIVRYLHLESDFLSIEPWSLISVGHSIITHSPYEHLALRVPIAYTVKAKQIVVKTVFI